MQLHPHQQEELAFLTQHPRAPLLSQTGSGKTPVLLTHTGRCLQSGGTALWITETGPRHQLETEAELWLAPDQQPVPLEKVKVKKRRNKFVACASHKDGKPVRFIHASHHLVSKRIDVLHWLQPDLVIVDEAAKIKGGADIWEAVTELAGRADQVVLATATPSSTTHGVDTYNLLRAAHLPDLPGTAAFMKHVDTDPVYLQPESIRPEGIRILQNFLSRYAIRHTVASIGKHIPAVEVHHHPVSLGRAESSAYQRTGNLGGLEGHQARQRLSRSEQALVPYTINLLLEQYKEHGKVLLFTENLDLLEPLHDALQQQGIGTVVITGAVPAKQRTDLVAQHREDDGIRVLLGTGALENGLNLQHASLLVTVVDTYNPARSVQREGRIARVGSTHQTVTHAVVSTDTTHEVRKADKRSQKERLANLLESAISGPDQHIKTVDEVQMPAPDLPEWPTCEHGEREPRSGTDKNGKPYRLWACPQPSGHGNCPPVWVNDPQDRAWHIHAGAEIRNSELRSIDEPPTSDTTTKPTCRHGTRTPRQGVSDKTVKGRRVRRRWRAFFCALGAGKPGRGECSPRWVTNPHDLQWSEHGSAAAFAAMSADQLQQWNTCREGRR